MALISHNFFIRLCRSHQIVSCSLISLPFSLLLSAFNARRISLKSHSSHCFTIYSQFYILITRFPQRRACLHTLIIFEQGSRLYVSLSDHLTTVFDMFTHPSPTATAPTVHFTYPPSYLLKFPPSPEPQVLNQPTADHSFARPFRIDPEFYNNALDVTIPMSIAIIYATTVTILNRVNKQREHKPWAFSKSLPFYAFVLIHNVFLALYSGWTFLGMIRAIHQSWPGWEGEYGFAGVVDTLCKLHGPRGLGSAATYSHESRTWSVTDTTIQLLQGSPDPTDVGRIWNEGLAFYGWLFYVSKFYDLVDTFIILAKGKKSSLLQTFHHAGAIMCMWAGIRYMSPPIWMFVLINSGLHTYMVSSNFDRFQLFYIMLIQNSVHLLHSFSPDSSNPGSYEESFDGLTNHSVYFWGIICHSSSIRSLQHSCVDPLPVHSQFLFRNSFSSFFRFLGAR